MINTIEQIDRVGVLNDLDGSGHPLAGLSLIYAVNGCGKSTLAAVLAAAGSGDVHSLNERRSLSAIHDPHVRLKLTDGKKRVFNNGEWTGTALRSHVFDTQFVDQNVHKGGEVTPSHRQGLLDIVIGQTAVEQQGALEAAQILVATAKSNVQRVHDEVLAMVHAVNPAATFSTLENLPVLDEDEAEARVGRAEAALIAGRNVSQIFALQMPTEMSKIDTDLTDLYEALGESLSELHGKARRRVAEHAAHLKASAFNISSESWLRAGVEIAHEGECPFCGQSTAGIELVDLYAEFFDTAYGSLRDRVERLRGRLGSSAQERLAKQVTAEYGRAKAATAAWASHLPLSSLPEVEPIVTTLSSIGKFADALMARKLEHFEKPHEAGDDGDALTTFAYTLPIVIEDVNAVVRQARAEIDAFKRSLSATGVPQLEDDLVSARLGRLRGSADVVRLLEEWAEAKKEAGRQEKVTARAREASKTAMNAILLQFEDAINNHLTKMGAQFSIEKVTSTFAGGTSRGNYGLKLRGTSIDISNGIPPFRLALSEGDKRTLAFAFFCAIVLRDEDLQGQVIVVDDPVTSLDKHRRSHTTSVLNEMSLRGAQIIVLAHDATYLRDVRNSFKKKKRDNHGASRTSTELQLRRSNSGDSMLGTHDLDRECESKYFRHYRLLGAFIHSEPQDGAPVSHTVAGAAIRPLLESYLHRRFPGRVPHDTLGAVIGQIENAAPTDVLACAKPIAAELDSINQWASDPHHDTDSDFPGHEADPEEVRAFAVRALKIVHGDH